MHGDHTSPLVSHSLNTGSNTLIATGLFPSSRISNWTGFSLPASYSNLDAHPVGSRKLLDSNRDYHAYTRPSAFLKSSSPFSSSELNTVSQHSAELKTKISSNNWEPSVPFRPSCILPSAFLSFSAQQYDPLRGRIELPKLANNSFEASFYSEGATAGKRLHQKVLPETVGGTRPPACDADTNSMSSHNTYQEKVLDNSCYTRDPTSPVTETETVGISVVYQNGTLTKDENPMGHSQVKGSTNPNKISICGDSRHQSDGSSSHQRDIKVDKFRENNEAEGEHLTDGDVQQESKEMKQFRGALIELVKELLKPKWREGSLSKDAHNKIVKKAVDKILSAFQPQQIPPTLEAVTQYLSACRPKISKLVEVRNFSLYMCENVRTQLCRSYVTDVIIFWNLTITSFICRDILRDMASPEMLGQVRFLLHSFILILLTGGDGQFVKDPIFFSFCLNICRIELLWKVSFLRCIADRLALLLFISSILWLNVVLTSCVV